MNTVIFNKLHGRIVEKYGSTAEFARHINISKPTMCHKLSGKSTFTKKDMEVWMNALDFGADQLAAYFFPEFLNEA